jgi:tetratricopeptide (TPR) repeat protein
MTSIPEAFQIALRHHQAGQLPQAEQVYRQILQAHPCHFEAMHMLGVLALQAGRHEAALGLISNAIRIEGNIAGLHHSLGEAYLAGGKLDDAQACFSKAANLDPALPQPHLQLAFVHGSRGDFQAAQDCCRHALVLKPDYAEAHYVLGNLLRQHGDPTAARACYERALASNPNYYEALLNLGSVSRECGQFDQSRVYLNRAIQLQPELADAHFFLGNLEAACKNWPLATACYENALQLNPKLAAAEVRLAVALQAQGQPEPATAHYRRAVELQPDSADAHYNWGTLLAEQGRLSEAVEHYELAVRYQLDHAGAHINLGAFHQNRGEESTALVHYDRALQIEPDAAELHFNRALMLLTRGELAAGWNDYAWRLRLPNFPVRVMSEPLWEGSLIPGKTLLIHDEQGLGDTLHFIRYVRLAKQRCAQVVVQVQSPLVPLLRQSGFDEVIGQPEALPAFDFQVPLLSLPGLLGTTLENIPADIPYLSVPSQAIATWRERLAGLDGFRVGIVWKGRSTHVGDKTRSIPLAEFAPLSGIPGVTLISLQKHEGEEQLGEVDFMVQQLTGDWDQVSGAFMDTAAVMQNLDLVITADTAAAHLAGAMGLNVWVALATKADWRWFRDRDDTPWYPTMRLFRQHRAGDWAELFERIASEIEQYATSRIRAKRAGESP